MKTFLSAICATALMLAGVASPAQADDHHHGHGGGGHEHHRGDRGYHGGERDHSRFGHGGLDHGRRGFHRRGWDHHDHHRHGGYDHDDGGSALAAGALGVVLGAAIADSQAHQAYARDHLGDQAWLNHCEARYKSFDPGSGTYLGYDGKRHYCQ